MDVDLAPDSGACVPAADDTGGLVPQPLLDIEARTTKAKDICADRREIHEIRLE
jgi:hypothetical protein